jgi:hypothetical protein
MNLSSCQSEGCRNVWCLYSARLLAMAGDDQISLGGIHCLTSHSEAFTLKSTSEALSFSCCKIHKADPPFSRFLVLYVQTKSDL